MVLIKKNKKTKKNKTKKNKTKTKQYETARQEKNLERSVYISCYWGKKVDNFYFRSTHLLASIDHICIIAFA